MSLVSKNIKHLRKQHKLTQEQLAEKIGIKRSLLGAYEEGRADPRLTNLLNIAKEFDVLVDTLISEDLSVMPTDSVATRSQVTADTSGQNLRILSITIDKQGNENIELVPDRAAAGYTVGYSDPEYLEDLPKFHLPILPSPGTYRAFEISGDSMLPITPGAVVVGHYVEDWTQIKSGETYVLVTQKEGIVYKRVFNYSGGMDRLLLVSDNKSYAPYDIAVSDILEVWEAKAYISTHFPEPNTEKELTMEGLTRMMIELQQEVKALREERNQNGLPPVDPIA
ncbi:MAG TPA: transcriptional regulator [Cytophagales bacterium]|nr:transcriptional regulator [Cytophagales bacterium]HAA17252.1 transcriptional regulator [Cytophagales bacterium]HAP60503.1 transcriptional regulator [Cytophagales bacterium]